MTSASGARAAIVTNVRASGANADRMISSSTLPPSTVRFARTPPEFGFLTSHGKTLLLIADDPRIRMRDIAGLLNVTERATQRIVADLARAGYIDRQREGFQLAIPLARFCA